MNSINFEVNLKLIIAIAAILVCSFNTNAQSVYKTPSGEKYHRYTCRMVENVSQKIILQVAIEEYGLEPCKICHPPTNDNFKSEFERNDKSKGEGISVRCKGYTKKGTRCKHKTRMGNGYCFQHNPDVNNVERTHKNPNTYKMPYNSSSASPRCGATTKSGGSCKRKVKGGGRCYQHG